MRQITLPQGLGKHQVRHLNAALKALHPYQRWDEWIKSPVCFLTALEIQLIEGYLNCQSFARLAERFNLTNAQASSTYRDALHKLYEGLPFYHQWVVSRSVKPPTRGEVFLNKPLFAHGLPPSVVHALQRKGNTFAEVLANVRNLHMLPGIGANHLKHIRRLFTENQCARHLPEPQQP